MERTELETGMQIMVRSSGTRHATILRITEKRILVRYSTTRRVGVERWYPLAGERIVTASQRQAGVWLPGQSWDRCDCSACQRVQRDLTAVSAESAPVTLDESIPDNTRGASAARVDRYALAARMHRESALARVASTRTAPVTADDVRPVSATPAYDAAVSTVGIDPDPSIVHDVFTMPDRPRYVPRYGVLVEYLHGDYGVLKAVIGECASWADGYALAAGIADSGRFDHVCGVIPLYASVSDF